MKEKEITKEIYDDDFYPTTIKIEIKSRRRLCSGYHYHLNVTLTLQGEIYKTVQIAFAKKIAKPFLKKYVEKNIMGLEKSRISISFETNSRTFFNKSSQNKKKLYITQRGCYIQ